MKPVHLSRPHAIMMVGLPGSGKTFFAQQFAETFNAPFINAAYVEERGRDEEASSELNAMFLGEIARTNQTFIYEGDSLSRTHRTDFARWARMHNYQPLFVWVQVDESTCRRRVLKAQTMTAEQFDSAVKRFSEPHVHEKPIVISGKRTYATQARTVLSRLGSENRSAARPSVQPAERVVQRPIRVQ